MGKGDADRQAGCELSLQQSYHTTLVYKVRLAFLNPIPAPELLQGVHIYTSLGLNGRTPGRQTQKAKHWPRRPPSWAPPLSPRWIVGNPMGITVESAPEPGAGVSENIEAPQAHPCLPSSLPYPTISIPCHLGILTPLGELY